MEELLESFVTAGLGLSLVSRIQEVNQLPEVQLRPTEPPPDGARVCAAWHTTEGRVIICATYHAEQSRRMRAHVVFLSTCSFGSSTEAFGLYRSFKHLAFCCRIN
jgi:DNA-binding transcriptional LysR family regulator